MPILIVYGLPKNVSDLDKLTNELRESVVAYPQFKLTAQQVTVFYPADCLDEGLGEEVIVFVEGLFKKPERTREVRQQWADSLRDLIILFAKHHLPQCQLVEVLVRSFDPDGEAFASQQMKGTENVG
jgi:hypothetical protein